MHPALPVPALVGFEHALALVAYEGAGRRLLTALKFRNERASVAPWLSAGMAELARPLEPDVVTWAPTSRARRQARGFDQAQVLAQGLARRLGLPAVALLRRLPGPAQTGRSLADRQQGPCFATRFAARAVVGRRVLVVDDVITSGVTMCRAGAGLHTARPAVLCAVAAAYTPPPDTRAAGSVGASTIQRRTPKQEAERGHRRQRTPDGGLGQAPGPG